MLDWLDEIPNLGVTGVPGVEPQKSAISEACSGVPAGVPGVPEPQPQSIADVPAVLREWQDKLNALDDLAPLHGLSRQRWRRLCEDARWLAEHFASRAAHDGWSTADLFGVWVGQDKCGGVADRLAGSRSLMMTADRAHWRSVVGKVPQQFNRSTYPDLHPLWEPSK